MRAVRFHEFGKPEVLQVDEVATPEPGPGEVLIKNHAAGINRMDVEMRAGVYGGEPLQDFYFGKSVELPFILGVEPAGEIAAVGEGVPKDLAKVGSRVTIHTHQHCGVCKQCKEGWDNACPSIAVFGVQTRNAGAYAEYFTTDYRQLIPLPDSVSYPEAAALQANYGPVFTGARLSNILPGDLVLVVGATGGVGVAAIQMAQLMGASVLATAGSPEKAKLLRERLGLRDEEIILHSEEGIAETTMARTGGAGADVVYELVGSPTWTESLDAAGIRGRVVCIGSHGGMRAETNLGNVFGKNLQIFGVTRANRSSMERLVLLCGEGKLSPAITTFPLEQAVEAHRLMEANSQFGKIVLTM